MSLVFNGTEVPSTGAVVFNSTNLRRVNFNDTLVWYEEPDVTDTELAQSYIEMASSPPETYQFTISLSQTATEVLSVFNGTVPVPGKNVFPAYCVTSSSATSGWKYNFDSVVLNPGGNSVTITVRYNGGEPSRIPSHSRYYRKIYFYTS